MRTLLLVAVATVAVVQVAFAGGAIDYLPLTVGNYWVSRCDSGIPATFSRVIDGTDTILGEEYFRIRDNRTEDDSLCCDSAWMWLREDTSGVVWGAYGDSPLLDSVQIFDPPILRMPNAAIDSGYTWEYDLPGLGHYKHVTESISENVTVPAGTFNDCIMVSHLLTSVPGETLQRSYGYFAQYVGVVLHKGWEAWSGDFRYELIEYLVGVHEHTSLEFPPTFVLLQNRPNPFSSVTTLSYNLPMSCHVSVKVYNVIGQEVATLVEELKKRGSYSVQWEPPGASSGIYLFRIVAGDYSETKKCILLK